MLILRTFPVIGQVSIRMGGTASRPFESSPSLGRGLSLRISPQGLARGAPPGTSLINALIIGLVVWLSLIPVWLDAQTLKSQANPEWDKLAAPGQNKKKKKKQ